MNALQIQNLSAATTYSIFSPTRWLRWSVSTWSGRFFGLGALAVIGFFIHKFLEHRRSMQNNAPEQKRGNESPPYFTAVSKKTLYGCYNEKKGPHVAEDKHVEAFLEFNPENIIEVFNRCVSPGVAQMSFARFDVKVSVDATIRFEQEVSRLSLWGVGSDKRVIFIPNIGRTAPSQKPTVTFTAIRKNGHVHTLELDIREVSARIFSINELNPPNQFTYTLKDLKPVQFVTEPKSRIIENKDSFESSWVTLESYGEASFAATNEKSQWIIDNKSPYIRTLHFVLTSQNEEVPEAERSISIPLAVQPYTQMHVLKEWIDDQWNLQGGKKIADPKLRWTVVEQRVFEPPVS